MAVILKVKEAAKILNVVPQKVRDLLRDKKLKGVRYSKNGDWRILSPDLLKFITGQANKKNLKE